MILKDSQEYPLVTITSPCYNHEKYVIQSLESIKAQTYPNIHHIIIDDASRDNSVKIIESWINENNYNCTFIKHAQNKGLSNTLNESIQLTSGKYWTALATDDYLLPERTKILVEYLEKNNVQMAVADMTIVNDQGKEIFMNGTSSFLHYRRSIHPFFDINTFGSYETLLFENYISNNYLIKTSVFKSIGSFNENLHVEDWDMWLRISAKYTIHFLDKSLGFFRKHNASTFIMAPEKMRSSLIKTFLNQKKYCYSNNKKELFHKAYNYHFINNYNPIKYPSTSFLFHQINIFIFFKALVIKFLALIRTKLHKKDKNIP